MANTQRPRAAKRTEPVKHRDVSPEAKRFRVSMHISPEWAEWLGVYAHTQSVRKRRKVEYGAVIEEALALLRAKTGCRVVLPEREPAVAAVGGGGPGVGGSGAGEPGSQTPATILEMSRSDSESAA